MRKSNISVSLSPPTNYFPANSATECMVHPIDQTLEWIHMLLILQRHHAYPYMGVFIDMINLSLWGDKWFHVYVLSCNWSANLCTSSNNYAWFSGGCAISIACRRNVFQVLRWNSILISRDPFKNGKSGCTFQFLVATPFPCCRTSWASPTTRIWCTQNSVFVNFYFWYYFQRLHGHDMLSAVHRLFAGISGGGSLV